MARKIQQVNGLVIAEYNPAEQASAGVGRYGVYTLDEWTAGPSWARYREMDFDNLDFAVQFAKDFNREVVG